MKLSSQEEYGLRCLLHIGRQPQGGSLTIPEISRAEGISEPYVAKLLRILRQEGFINSVRGQSGGYALARTPAEIVIGQVLAALGGRFYESDFCARHAGSEDSCAHSSESVDCSIRTLWMALQGSVDRVLDKITLADLLGTAQQVSGLTQLGAVPVEAPRR